MSEKLIWLSHLLDHKTPAYGGGKAFNCEAHKQISCGDSCNSVHLTLSNHIGSHVDAPYHFVLQGKKLEEYTPHDWIFLKPVLLDIELEAAEIITEKHIENLALLNKEADLILFRTGFEKYREDECYWKMAPGFSPDLADYLLNYFPALKAIAMDTLSLTSFQHRELGREAHKNFLSRDIRLFEDLSLSGIPIGSQLKKVMAFPLRFLGSDGAPCTVIGWIEEII